MSELQDLLSQNGHDQPLPWIWDCDSQWARMFFKRWSRV